MSKAKQNGKPQPLVQKETPRAVTNERRLSEQPNKGKPETTTEPSEYDGWEDIGKLTSDGDYAGYTWPKDRIPAFARPGMVADCINNGQGIIETVTADICVVRFPNGEVWPFRWGEVSLHDVRPDPLYLPAHPSTGMSLPQLRATVVAMLKKEHGDDVLEKTPRVLLSATSSIDSGGGDVYDVDLDEEIKSACAGDEDRRFAAMNFEDPDVFSLRRLTREIDLFLKSEGHDTTRIARRGVVFDRLDSDGTPDTDYVTILLPHDFEEEQE